MVTNLILSLILVFSMASNNETRRGGIGPMVAGLRNRAGFPIDGGGVPIPKGGGGFPIDPGGVPIPKPQPIDPIVPIPKPTPIDDGGVPIPKQPWWMQMHKGIY